MAVLNVKAVCDMTGVNPNTLRAWERRYQAVRPARSQSGRRGYGLNEVERIRMLGGLVQQGHAIGTLAKLSNKELHELLSKVNASGESFRSESAPMLQAVLKGVQNFAPKFIHETLVRARASLSLRSFILDFVAPLMSEVGALVSAGVISIAQEHILSALLRSELSQLLLPLGQGDQAKQRFIFTTPEADYHEFGVLLSAVLAASRGVGVLYLGPNMPAHALAEVARATGATHIVVGTSPASSAQIVAYIEELQKGTSLPIWVGGVGASKVRDRVVVMSSLKEIDDKFAKMANESLKD